MTGMSMCLSPYYHDSWCEIHNGDCVSVMQTLEDDSIDAIVTDPPYGIGFMGKGWDATVPGVDIWVECLRVLKPGGHLLAFAGTRTQHRMACAIEDAGFEIRDMIAWVYGSGFPKSLDVSKAIDKAAGVAREVVGDGNRETLNAMGDGLKNRCVKCDKPFFSGNPCQCPKAAATTDAAKQWSGWGTALKPSLEPITMARKPLIGTVAANVLQYGTGGVNVEACRIDLNGDYKCKANGRPSQTGLGDNYDSANANQPDKQGRWPANLIHDGSGEVLALFPDTQSGAMSAGTKRSTRKGNAFGTQCKETLNDTIGDSGSAARFFYTAKADSTERRQSNHPTVKPLDLIRYLVRIVTPEGGVVLDPFLGSGTLCEAARAEHCRSIGIELDESYCADAVERLRQGVLF